MEKYLKQVMPDLRDIKNERVGKDARSIVVQFSNDQGSSSYETIGRAMAQDCRNNTSNIWGHELLRHNSSEIARFANEPARFCLTA